MRFVLLCFALFSVGCEFPGRRLLEARVEQDGKTLLRKQFDVSDSLGPAAAWNELKGQNFESVAAITPDAQDPLRAFLRGKLRIVLQDHHASFAAVELDELVLTRADENSSEWRIPIEEIQRTTPPQ